MKNWVKRILGREREEESQQTHAELNQIEERMRQYELRVQHLRRERGLYDRRRRGITG